MISGLIEIFGHNAVVISKDETTIDILGKDNNGAAIKHAIKT
jgi:hypothetical protein